MKDGSGNDLLAVLSHELRNPLQSILGWVRVLEKEGSRERTRLGLAAIERSAQLMSEIVDDLADRSRICVGKLDLRLESLPVGGLMRDAVAAVLPAAARRHIHVGLKLPPRLPSIRGDRVRLMQVLANLLSNALKFTPDGGWIELEASAAGGRVHLIVRDSGCGIHPELLPHLFDRYRQGGAAAALGQGLGLGLNLVKEFVERHGGSVSATSEGSGRGASFTVMLPQEHAIGSARDAGGELSAPESARARAGASPPRPDS